MSQLDTGNGWEIGQEVRYRHSTPGFAEIDLPPTDSQVSIIARLPDLDAPTVGRPQPSRRESRSSRAANGGRLIGQGLSMKFLGLVGLLLFALAIVPWMFGGKSDNGETADPPDWQQERPPKFAAPRMASKPAAEEPQMLAEAPPVEQAPQTPMTPAPEKPAATPEAVAVESTQPDAAGGTAGAPPPSPEWPERPQAPIVEVPPHAALGKPRSAGNPSPVEPGPHAGAMQPMHIQPPVPGMAGASAPQPQPPAPRTATYPQHTVPSYPPQRQPAPPVRPGTVGSQFANPTAPPAPGTSAVAQPGVADFQGIIESPPPATTSHDRTRPGVH